MIKEGVVDCKLVYCEEDHNLFCVHITNASIKYLFYSRYQLITINESSVNINCSCYFTSLNENLFYSFQVCNLLVRIFPLPLEFFVSCHLYQEFSMRHIHPFFYLVFVFCFYHYCSTFLRSLLFWYINIYQSVFSYQRFTMLLLCSHN